MRVLICVGDPTTSLDLWRLLHDQGHVVAASARTPAKCLELAKRTWPHLAIVDSALGQGSRLSGSDLVEALAEAGVPSIVLVGEPHEVPPTTSAKAVVSKPFSESHMASAMVQIGQTHGLRARGR